MISSPERMLGIIEIGLGRDDRKAFWEFVLSQAKCDLTTFSSLRY
jgi:hypothetical protein